MITRALSLYLGDYAATVQSCTASSQHGSHECDRAFDGIALTSSQWVSHGEGPGAWIKAQFDRVFIPISFSILTILDNYVLKITTRNKWLVAIKGSSVLLFDET